MPAAGVEPALNDDVMPSNAELCQVLFQNKKKSGAEAPPELCEKRVHALPFFSRFEPVNEVLHNARVESLCLEFCGAFVVRAVLARPNITGGLYVVLSGDALE